MTIYGKGCISNYRNCSLCYVWYSVLYRMLTDLDQKPSKYREFRSTGLDLALKSEGELGMDDVENWIKGSVGTYAMMQGRKVNDD